jgi:hypothetical protein
MALRVNLARGVMLTADGSTVNGNKLFTAAKLDDMIFTDGVGNGQANRFYRKTAVIAASGTDTIDLAGALTDEFGVALTFVKIRGLFVEADLTNTNNVNVFAGSNPLVGLLGGTTPTINLKPGEFFQWGAPGAGLTVTPATGDIWTFTNSGAGTSVTYRAIIWGTDA